MKPKRKDPCPCGSGKRFKHCCGSAKPADAADTLARVHPSNAGALYQLGMLALSSGNAAKARALIERCLALAPGNAEFRSGYAMVCEILEDWSSARDAWQRVLELTPGSMRAELGLANAHRRLDALDRAIVHYRRALGLAPANGLAWMELGTALMRLEPPDHAGAEACFRELIRLAPDQGIGHNCLGVALAMQDRNGEARAALSRAVELDPKQAAAWYNLARICLMQDDVNPAIDAYRQAVALAPDNDDFHRQIAHALQMRGKFDVAERFYARALELDPESLSTLARLIEYKRFDSLDDPLLTQAQAMVDGASDDATEVTGLCFSLGKIFDRLKEYERAFAYYARGNRLRQRACAANEQSGSPFSSQEFPKLVDRIIAEFDAENLARYRLWGHPSERPILIVGMPRSGTTLTEQIIAAHPEVASGGERGFWGHARNQIDEGKLALDEAGVRKLAEDYLADLATVPGADSAARVTDKMPHNFLTVGLIHAAFPNARVIHVRRHPMDNCLSIFFQNFNDAHAYSFDLEELARHYREYRRMMAHWRQIMPADRLFELDYEDLVADQEGMSRRLIEFCGLEWNDDCLRYYENENAVKTASIWQVRQKIYASSVERWRNYTPYIGPLIELLQDGG